MASMEDSDQQLTQSGAMIGSNDDLLTEILHRLPVTSILRFKSVSKHWRWLLSHRHFTLRYDNLSKSPGLFLGQYSYVPFDIENRSIPPLLCSLGFGFHDINIVQSCNGLLLCSSSDYYGDRNYYVFNPTTKQLATIPPVPGGYRVCKSICFMGLAFHQTDCVHYKVICVLKIDPELFQIQIYSFDTGKWKISIESFFADNPTFNKGVYWNGAIHWHPSINSHLYFKIDVEQLQSLPLSVRFPKMYFGESRGHLHLIAKCYRRGDSWFQLKVYELLRDHSGWFVKYQLDLDERFYASLGMSDQPIYDFQVIDVVRGAEEEDTFMVLIINPRKLIITYNFHHKSFKPICSLTNDYFYETSSSFHRYTETLASF